VDEVCRYFGGRGETFEVIVADDGSQDDTAARITAPILCISAPRNEGKGAAVKRGVEASRGERVLVTDADLSTPLTELPRLEAELEKGADIAIGSRAKSGAQLVRRQPIYRELAGRAGNLVIRGLCPQLKDLRDTQCGFKLFRGDTARGLFAKQRLFRFGFDVEILYLGRKAGLRVAEVPVVWAHGESSKVRAKDYAYTLMEVARIRWMDWRGLYGR